MNTSKTLGFSSVVLEAPAIGENRAWTGPRSGLERLVSGSRISYHLKRAALALVGTALILFLGYQAVILCMIHAQVMTFTKNNFVTEAGELLGARFTLTRFEPQREENHGWVIQRDIARYRKDSYYILPSNIKADTEATATLAIYRQRWFGTSQ